LECAEKLEDEQFEQSGIWENVGWVVGESDIDREKLAREKERVRTGIEAK
jgi:hypothetical protein